MLTLQVNINERFHRMLCYMLTDLVCCWQRPSPELLNCEAAFLLAQRHCTEMQSAVFLHNFRDDAEEINFLKHLLPQFAGLLLYYSILYEGLHSCPADKEMAVAFWGRETNRFSRFRERNLLLVDYLESQRTELDDELFLTRNSHSPSQPSLYEKIFHWDDRCSSTGSAIAAALVAERFYFDYANSRLL